MQYYQLFADGFGGERSAINGACLEDGDIIEAGGTTFKVAYTANAATLTVRQTGTVIRVL